MGAGPTGEPAQRLGTGVYRIRNGEIPEATFAEAILGRLFQLGVTTLPSAA
ncbi:hypothetical protein [Streptomyces sp. NPDC127098]|uniref:hypothetical protein n=1 Tax=Streptomyces sp. NPDC127098 TaxID=3347137 RepID=UPI00365E13D4